MKNIYPLILLILILTACGSESNKSTEHPPTSSGGSQPNVISQQETFNINVFLENSGSMNGYLNDPNTQFKNSVYSLLTRLKLFADKDSLNLFLVNKEDQLIYGNASNSDVEGFKDILNPASFAKISKGKTGETDINELIKRSLQKVDKKNLSVFISDCIYSPGKQRPDAAMYLAEQKQGIYLNFATEIRDRNSDVAVIILHLEAGFNGVYYDKQDNKIEYNSPVKRPYYIWFIGTQDQIQQIIASKKLEELDGGYVNKAVLQPAKDDPIKFRIQSKPRIGDFDRKSLQQGIIADASASKNNQNKGIFGFNVAVDLSNSLQDDRYFLDAANYKLSNPGYQLEVEENPDKNSPSLSGFTHILKLQTTEVRDEVLKIDIVGKTPSWVYAVTSNDDSNILTDDDEKTKTFGLKYLIEGVSDAFYPISEPNTISTLNVQIKR